MASIYRDRALYTTFKFLLYNKNQNIYQGSKDSAQTFSSTFLRKCSGSKVNAANNILIADIYLFAKVLSFEILCIIQNF